MSPVGVSDFGLTAISAEVGIIVVAILSVCMVMIEWISCCDQGAPVGAWRVFLEKLWNGLVVSFLWCLHADFILCFTRKSSTWAVLSGCTRSKIGFLGPWGSKASSHLRAW